MKTTLAVACLTVSLAIPLLAQPAAPPPTPASPPAAAAAAAPAADIAADPQVRAAQVNLQLATMSLGLAEVQAKMKAGQFADAKDELARVRTLFPAVGEQNAAPYRAVADRLAKDIDNKEYTARRLEVVKQYGQSPIPESAFTQGPGYGQPKLTDPREPGLNGQVGAAAEQVKLAEQNGYTNPADTRVELANDPTVIKQRTLDHQTLWDEGRYTPAKELIDVGKMLELDHERIMYQASVKAVTDGARRDELLHVQEALVPPPAVMNFPSDWKQLAAARGARYSADGKLAESAPFKDADGKTKTIAIYDVSDLMFVPIFPGPSEYNVNRPAAALDYWVQQERLRDLYTHPPYSFYPPGYNDALYGGPGPVMMPMPAQGGAAVPGAAYAPGAAAIPGVVAGPGGGPVAGVNIVPGAIASGVGGSRMGIGGYCGYRVTDIIPSAYYYSYESDPLYQYRMAVKRTQLLTNINRMLSAVQD